MKYKGLRYFIAILFFVCSLGKVVNAQTPGAIDTAFYKGMGVDRIVRNGVEMADGSVVIVGDLGFANQKALKGVAKLNADGSTDYTYNSGGVGTNNYVTSIVKQFSNKVIIGGIFTQYNGVTTNRIARLNANGTKDATFTATIGNGYVTGLCMQSDTIADSSFVAVGTFTSVNSTTTNRIVRFKYDGTKDATFTPGTGANNTIYAIDRQADGKYIIAGAFTSYNGTSINRIARLNADGTLDTSFDPGTGPNSDIGTICVLPNGKIMISGVYLTAYGSTSITRIAMLNSDGSLCTTFSSGSGLNNNAYKFLLDNDKILVTGGFASYNGASVPFLMRIDTTGTRDSTFVVGTGLDYYGYNIFKGASNNLFIVGQFTKYDNYSRGNIVKISSSGAIQQDFAQNGLLNSEILCASIQSDGKIIVGGAFTKYSDVSISYVVRLNTDGTLDNTFNTGSGPNTSVSALAIQPDGKIIVGGSFTTFNGSTANDLVRLNTDGSLDNTFSSGSGFGCCGVNKIKVLSSGKIMVSGNFGSYRGVQKYRIVRLNSDGTLDNSFTPPLSNLANAGYKDFAVQKNGKIVVVGDFQSVRDVWHYCIFRMDSTGTLDTTFRHGLGKDNYHAINSVVIQEDGKIIVAGGQNMYFDGIARSRICRLNIDGSVDLSYNIDDQALPGSGAGAYISSIIPYGTGVICVGNYAGRSMQFVNQNGQYETNYFNNTGISNYGDYIRAIIKDDERGRLLMYGSYEKLNGQLSLGFTSLANYIDDVRTDKQLCTGVNSVVFFDKNVTFNSGNVFTVQLSNASGSFASPVEIGRDTTDGWGGDSIKIVIPSGTSSGSGYRLRIVSTTPSYTSVLSDAITIGTTPALKTVLQAQAAVYPSLGTEVKVVASQTGVHYSLISDTTVVDTGNGSGDTLRLRTGSIYNAKSFVVKAQFGGCSLALDTIIVDTLGLRHVEWQWEGFTKNPDNSITAEPEPGDDKMEGKSYNLIKRGKDGFVSFDLHSDNDYAGYLAFGDYNSSADVAIGFLLAQDTTSGPDTAGLYLMLKKDEFIPLRGLNGTALNIAVHKHGSIGDIYVNGLLQDTTITWPDTLDYDIELACFASGSNIKSVKTSYTEYLRWNELQPTHANCGSKGSAMVSALGGIPPYHFNWSNGDTTDTPDSLTVGTYHVTVTDFAGDTLIDSVDIVYNAMMDTAHNVGPDSSGRMVSSGFTEFFSSYCWYINTLAVGQDGWIRFDVPEGTNFQGYAGFSSNTLFDESHSGFGIMALGNSLYVTGDDIEGMTYLGSYEAGQKLSLKMRFEGDYLYCGKEEEWGTMEMSFYLPRTTIFRPGVVQLAEGSIYPNVATTFSCDQMFTHVSVVPTTDISAQGQIRIDIKGGNPPYAYLWSNSANTPTINVLPGIYTVTVSDANSTSITAQAFVGTYVEWLAANNVEENLLHEIVATENTPEGYSIQHNYIFGAQALAPGQDGCFSFDFARAGDFAGSIGVSTDYLMSYGTQGFGLVIVQDRMNFGIDPEIYYVDEEGQMQYFGLFTEQMPMNIKIKKTGTFVEIVKNDVGGISREYTDPLTFRPIISPVFAGDKITRVTANVGVPLQSIAAAQPASCGGGNLGSISLDIRGGQPPYHFNWSNGDTTSTPDSLEVGLYTVQIWDAQLDTIVDSIYIGYGMDWDTTFNVGDTLGMLVSTGNNSTVSFDSYAYALNSLAPGEDGWVEFEIPQNTVYNGAMAMNANKHYDETTEGIGINIVDGYIIVRGSMISGNTIMAPYKQAAGYRFRIEFNGSNIDVIYKDLLGLAPGRKISVNYTRTQAWSPTIIFGLNGAKISSISSSFGCGGMHADVQLLPAAKDGNTGSIYSQVKGGFPPYTYTWSNSSSSANLVNVPIGNYSLTVQDQSGATQVVNTFLGRYTDWDVLSGMAEVGNGVVYEGDTVDFDSTIVSFAIAKNAIKPGASGTVSFDFEKAGDFVGAVGLSESADLSVSQDGALAVVGLIDGDLYILDENGDPAFFGKLRENLPVNILVYKTPTDFTITKNNLSSIIINRATTGYLSPVVIPGFPGDKVQRVTCDFGRQLSVRPIVTPISCGTTNTGSITTQVIGGIPPYSYYWNTGDTTDVNDSLTIGNYRVAVTDSIGDSAVANITMGYGATWGSLVGVTVDGTNSLSPTLPFAGSAYAVGASTLYPIVGESGWMEFKVDAGVPFEGYFGLVNDMTFDENMVGLGLLINDGHIYSSDTDPENENMYLGRYNQAVENKIRITKIADDEIEITVNGIVVLESEYEYPNTFKPVVYLNNDKSKVRSLVSSFCNTYADEFTLAYEVVHLNDNRKGGIYIEPVGGTPPFNYAWNDLDNSGTHLNSFYISNLLNELGIDSADIDSLIGGYTASNNRNRFDLSAGEYTVTVTDAAFHSLTKTFTIGNISKFAITDESLSNIGGVITKVSSSLTFSDNACISLGSCNESGDASTTIELQVMGDFDFGYRDLSLGLLEEDLSTVSNFDYESEEYYYIEIRSGQMTYKSHNNTALVLGNIAIGDKLTISMVGSNILLRLNGNVLATKARSSSSDVFLNTVARLYHPSSAFKILENVLY